MTIRARNKRSAEEIFFTFRFWFRLFFFTKLLEAFNRARWKEMIQIMRLTSFKQVSVVLRRINTWCSAACTLQDPIAAYEKEFNKPKIAIGTIFFPKTKISVLQKSTWKICQSNQSIMLTIFGVVSPKGNRNQKVKMTSTVRNKLTTKVMCLYVSHSASDLSEGLLLDLSDILDKEDLK